MLDLELRLVARKDGVEGEEKHSWKVDGVWRGGMVLDQLDCLAAIQNASPCVNAV
jgi:hypothetical protein